MARVAVWLIRLYQRLSRRFPPVCRFQPTCSEYMIQAIHTHGFFRGVLLGAWRILRCNPFCKSGDDPVPPARPSSHSREHS